MDAEEMKKYEEAVRDVIGMHAIVLGRGGAGYVEFDAWLAAHDAEVQAQVVAEEPEWEYTRQAEANGWTGPAVYRDEAHASDGLMHGWRVVRRRKAGPWSMVRPEDVRTVLAALRAAGVTRG